MFKARPSSARILPKADPLTADLNVDFAVASRTVHSNFVAVAGRVSSTFDELDGGKIIKYRII
jgi:hypothetical protein